MQGCDGFGCKLAGKKVIKEDTGEKEEIKMVFLDGQITDFADNIEAVKQIKKKIVKTLSGGSLDPEIVMHGGWGMACDKPGLSACFFCRVFHGRFSEEETKAGASGNTGLPGGGKTLF